MAVGTSKSHRKRGKRDLKDGCSIHAFLFLLFETSPDGGGTTSSDYVVVSIKYFDCRLRRELITACVEFQAGPHRLRTDEGTARVIAAMREGKRIILPAMFPLPDSVAGTT